MRPQRLVGLIIILTSVLLILAARHWYSTRIFTPLDQPISLARGQATTREFRINLSTYYFVQVDFDQDYAWDRLCNAGNIQTKWKLRTRGQVVKTSVRPWFPSGVIDGPWLDEFEASPGSYSLELEVLSDSSCLDRYSPRLRIVTYHGHIYDNYLVAVWILWFTLFSGAFLSIRPAVSVRIPPEASLSITGTDSFESGSLVRHRRLRREARKFSGIPSYGLIASLVLISILIPVWIIQSWLTAYWEPKGVWVYMPQVRPVIQIPAKDDFPVLRLERKDQNVALFIDSKPVRKENVKNALTTALQTRARKFVYLSVDPELHYSDAAQGIDLIHSVRAEVILYTPKMGAPEFSPLKPPSLHSAQPVK